MSDHSYVHHVARQSGSNFYYSFFSLPKPKRQAMTAVYAFCREVDDAVDDPKNTNPAQSVAEWREEINRTYDGHPTRPLTRSLLESIELFQLTKAYFDGILDGVTMDLGASRYPTYEALQAYCYHVAGEVGLLCMEIFGYRSERLKSYAVKLGLAFQLTNILRDVKADADNGRIYIPQEDLRRFGVEEEELLKWATGRRSTGTTGNPNGSPPLPYPQSPRRFQFQRLMAFEARRARSLYQEVAALPTPEERPALRAAEIMRAIYSNVLKRIERRQYNVFGGRIRVPTPVKIGLALKAFWECRP